MNLTEQLKAAYDLAGGQTGKPIRADKFTLAGVDTAKLKIRGYLGSGHNDGGDAFWITNKCVIAVEDDE